MLGESGSSRLTDPGGAGPRSENPGGRGPRSENPGGRGPRSENRSVNHPRAEEIAGQADEILEPQRLEPQLGAELAQLVRYRVVEEIIARDDGDGDGSLVLLGTQAPQEPQTVDERHAQIEDDGVRLAPLRLDKAPFGGHRRAYLVALEPQHAGECLGHPLVVVDNQDFRRDGVGHGRLHGNIVTDARSSACRWSAAELDIIMLNFLVLISLSHPMFWRSR